MFFMQLSALWFLNSNLNVYLDLSKTHTHIYIYCRTPRIYEFYLIFILYFLNVLEYKESPSRLTYVLQ